MSDFPKEAEALLSVAPDDFVTERNRLARELRDAGRKDEARGTARRRGGHRGPTVEEWDG
jgi:hypothetical protein